MNNTMTIERSPTPEYTGEWVTCSCCGKDIHDTPEDNRDFEERGQDAGYGHCTDCFGTPTAGTDEASVRKRLGWAGEVFYDTRIETLGNALTGANLEKFRATTYAKKVVLIGKMIEKGYMI